MIYMLKMSAVCWFLLAISSANSYAKKIEKVADLTPILKCSAEAHVKWGGSLNEVMSKFDRFSRQSLFRRYSQLSLQTENEILGESVYSQSIKNDHNEIKFEEVHSISKVDRNQWPLLYKSLKNYNSTFSKIELVVQLSTSQNFLKKYYFVDLNLTKNTDSVHGLLGVNSHVESQSYVLSHIKNWTPILRQLFPEIQASQFGMRQAENYFRISKSIDLKFKNIQFGRFQIFNKIYFSEQAKKFENSGSIIQLSWACLDKESDSLGNKIWDQLRKESKVFGLKN